MKEPMVSFGRPPQVMTLKEFLARPPYIPTASKEEIATREREAQAWEPAGRYQGD